jgi:hypothetical protein
MLDILMVFYALLAALVTTGLYAIYKRMSYLKNKGLLLLLLGMVLAIFIVMIHPQYKNGLLDPANVFYLLFVLPLFILIPLPYIENKTGVFFNKISVFSGSFVEAILYFIVFQVVLYFPGFQGPIKSLADLVFILVFSFLIFVLIYHIQQSLSETMKDKPAFSEPGIIITSPAGGGAEIIFIVVILLIICSPFLLLEYIDDASSCTGFDIWMVNQSQTTNSTIIHLTDDDLRQYPKLGTIIRNSQKSAGNPAAKTYKVEFSCSEQSKITWYDRFAGYYPGSGKNAYLEYNGTFYATGQVWIH